MNLSKLRKDNLALNKMMAEIKRLIKGVKTVAIKSTDDIVDDDDTIYLRIIYA